MSIHRYKQTPIRLNKRDQKRLAKIKNWYQCESTTQAIRLALYELAKGQ